MVKQLMLFSKGMWKKFGKTIMKSQFSPSSFYYNFRGRGREDVRIVANYYKDKNEFKQLLTIVKENYLIAGNEFDTVKRIMIWVNKNYPSSLYYKPDKTEKWNKPSETFKSWNDRKAMVEAKPDKSDWYWKYFSKQFKDYPISTDCDDYAIFIYNLCVVAGVNPDNLFLTFMKTYGEWHMNVMYFDGETPYAVEGTYRPERAIQYFGEVPYFNLKVLASGFWRWYYLYVKYYWNHKKVFKNNNKLNKLGE